MVSKSICCSCSLESFEKSALIQEEKDVTLKVLESLEFDGAVTDVQSTHTPHNTHQDVWFIFTMYCNSVALIRSTLLLSKQSNIHKD